MSGKFQKTKQRIGENVKKECGKNDRTKKVGGLMALKITDATKDEFLQFFATNSNGINCKPHFLRWLSNKRWRETSEAYDTALNASQDAFEQYLKLLEKATAEKDFDKKVHYLTEANEKRSLAKKYDAEIKRLEAKQDKMTE